MERDNSEVMSDVHTPSSYHGDGARRMDVEVDADKSMEQLQQLELHRQRTSKLTY